MNDAIGTTFKFALFAIILLVIWFQVVVPGAADAGQCFSPTACITEFERGIDRQLDSMAW